MSIKTKIIFVSIFLALIPMGISSLVIGNNANSIGQEGLETQAKNQLISIREMKKSQIEGYFHTIRNQVLTFSNDRMVINAMREFKAGFRTFRDEAESSGPLSEQTLSTYKSELSKYYSGDFTQEYGKRNAGGNPNALTLLQQLDQDSLALQYHYIQANPNTLGNKDGLIASPDQSSYSKLHQKYHPHFRDFLNKFSYYDIFLVDSETGDLVYTVFKELDYSTSMIDGPYAKTGIGQAFREANQASTPDAVALTDFGPYLPSYQDQAGFIASPIYDGEEKLGVLIFQMPISMINGVMTNEGKWEQVGLGTSGETYLIGPDFTMRNQSRFLLEDEANYFTAIENIGLPQHAINLIKAKRSSIGLQSVKTQGTQAAMSGETGFAIFPDYRNVPVLSAYAPLNIPGLRWAIMSEIDKAEAFVAVNTLSQSIQSNIAWMLAIVLLIVCPMGMLIGRWGARRIHAVTHIAEKVANGDLSKRVPVTSMDELGKMSQALNDMFDKVSHVLFEVRQTAEQVSSGSTQISDGNEDLSERTALQAGSVQQTASSMEEMTSSVKQNADNSKQANQLAKASREIAEKGGTVTVKAVEAMEEINTSSNKIAEIINVIDEIAFQTNLLALNAAVEAARAGEQGRGFAVVASEVRNLAQRSATSAKEIKGLIQESVQKVNDGSKLVNASGRTLEEIVHSVKEVTDIIAEISTASQEQTGGIDQVNKSIMQMDQTTQQNAGLVEEVTANAQTMKEQSRNLLKQVSFFKLADEAQHSEFKIPGTRRQAKHSANEKLKRLPISESVPTEKATNQKQSEGFVNVQSGNGTYSSDRDKNLFEEF